MFGPCTEFGACLLPLVKPCCAATATTRWIVWSIVRHLLNPVFSAFIAKADWLQRYRARCGVAFSNMTTSYWRNFGARV